MVGGDDFGLVEDVGGVYQRIERGTKTISVRWESLCCPLDYPASNIAGYGFIEDQEEEDSRPQPISIALQVLKEK